MAANKSSISKSSSLEKMGEFWDTHDFTEFDDIHAPDVEFHVTVAIPVEPDLLSDIEILAHQRGISVETLVNLWLKEKLIETRAG
ncbi:MAG: CopG family antitoxin [Anaerolineae bacterium]